MDHLISKKKQFSEYYPFLFLILGFTVCFIYSFQFELYEGGADNYIHYRVSRYAFTYPELFLDHWGKPVFTLLSSPFAQFGFKGIVFFNVLCGILASYFAFKVAKQIGLKESWSAALFILCMPVYYIMMVSAMTEVLFSFLIILSIYLLLNDKFIFSAILFSSLFLVRTEAYILYPVVMLVYIYKKQWRIIPFLFTGFLVYSTIGWFHFSDFFWLINQNPYGNASEIYGTGELLFFVKNYGYISGAPIGFLLVLGTVIAFLSGIALFLQKKEIKIDFILIEVLFIIYFAAHSYVWWSGTGASAGLIRVMAAIVPLMAVSASRGYDYIWQKLKLISVVRIILHLGLFIYLFTIPFSTYELPLKNKEREKTILASLDWFMNSKYKTRKVFFYEPLVYFVLERDPFNNEIITELIKDLDHPENSVKDGEIVFYDMQFGPNEGRLPLERLMDNPHFRLINYFEPINEFTVLGGYKYGMLIFERVKSNKKNNHLLLEDFKKNKIIKMVWLKNENKNTAITVNEFTPLQETQVSKINKLHDYQWMTASLSYELEKSSSEVMLVISIEQNGEAIVYSTINLIADGKTHITENSTIISNEIDGGENLKIYIWNKSKTKGIVHSLDVSLVNKTY